MMCIHKRPKRRTKAFFFHEESQDYRTVFSFTSLQIADIKASCCDGGQEVLSLQLAFVPPTGSQHKKYIDSIMNVYRVTLLIVHRTYLSYTFCFFYLFVFVRQFFLHSQIFQSRYAIYKVQLLYGTIASHGAIVKQDPYCIVEEINF